MAKKVTHETEPEEQEQEPLPEIVSTVFICGHCFLTYTANGVDQEKAVMRQTCACRATHGSIQPA